MAVSGSKDYFQYVDDQGRIWNALLDVSEQTALGATRGALQAASNEGRLLKVSTKRPLTARYIIFRSTTEAARTITKVICDPTSDLWLGVQNSYTQDGELFIATSRHGESRYNIPTVDTNIVEPAT
jgi:hypothetical protein